MAASQKAARSAPICGDADPRGPDNAKYLGEDEIAQAEFLAKGGLLGTRGLHGSTMMTHRAAKYEEIGGKKICNGPGRNAHEIRGQIGHSVCTHQDAHSRHVADERDQAHAEIETQQTGDGRAGTGAVAPRPALVPGEIMKDDAFDCERRARQITEPQGAMEESERR